MNLKEEKLTILLLPAHEPIDTELMLSWLEQKHEVYLYPHRVKWTDKMGSLPSEVTLGLPKKPDVIFCGIKEDAYFALQLKILKMWLNVPIIMIHWWFPSRTPIYYFVRNISVCQYGQEYLKNLLKINSSVVYCPVDTDFFKPKFEDQEKTALIIGNNFKERDIMGYPYLIDIIDKVHRLDSEIELILMGYNSSDDFPEHVECLFCNKPEMLQYINRASSVFFTTTRNLIMHSMEISMSCGKNVIAFDLPSFHEVIIEGESGFLIPRFNTDLFAQRIVETTNNPSVEMGKNARKLIVEKCERRKVAKQLIDSTYRRASGNAQDAHL